MEQPNAKWHLIISLAKSILRVGAGFYLITGDFLMSGVMFIIAEALGIVEELV